MGLLLKALGLEVHGMESPPEVLNSKFLKP